MASGEIVRSRVTLTGISSRAYEHPADRGALTALRSVPGWDGVLRAMSGVLRERSLRLLYLASSVRASERQFSGLHGLLVDGARTLDMPSLPELYVTSSPTVNAMALGMDRPFIVVTTGLLDLMDDDELRFVVGHELGHVLSGHAVYRTMLVQLLAVSARMAWLPIGGLAIRAVVLALEEWQRKSELSCDRAGLLVCQDPAVALRAQMKTAGGARLDDMDPTELLEQAREYEEDGDIRDGALKVLNLIGSGSHPFAVVRAAALRKWVEEGEYAAILGGDYPRRADDPASSPTADVREALRSYAKSFGESADPLITFLREAGSGASGAANGAAQWVRGVFRQEPRPTPPPPAPEPDGRPESDDEAEGSPS